MTPVEEEPATGIPSLGKFIHYFSNSVLEFLHNLWGLGTGLSYRPARLHRLTGLSPGLLKSLKIRGSDHPDRYDLGRPYPVPESPESIVMDPEAVFSCSVCTITMQLLYNLLMTSSRVVRVSDCQCNSQQSWVQSQHPSIHRNLRGGRSSSVE
jgi:hypothetical protein